MQKDSRELNKVSELMLGFNQFGRSLFQEMIPYLDEDIKNQLQQAQAGSTPPTMSWPER